MSTWADVVVGAVDHTADHIQEWGCFPVEHETVSGQVLDMTELCALLEQEVPAFLGLCLAYIEEETYV